jgi:chromosome segregation ATPase
MSDKKKPLDLDTAQRLYIAAGQPEQAKAAGFLIDAVRNTVQGEWGTAFVNSLEGMLVRHITPLVEGQKETLSGIAALSVQFQTLAETVDGLQTAMHESQEDRRVIHEELAEVKSQLTTYIAGSKRGELEVLKAATAAHDTRLDLFEKKVAADIQTRLERDDTRLTSLEERGEELQAIRTELREARELLTALAERIGGALPTEADQDLSAALRAGRGG